MRAKSRWKRPEMTGWMPVFLFFSFLFFLFFLFRCRTKANAGEIVLRPVAGLPLTINSYFGFALNFLFFPFLFPTLPFGRVRWWRWKSWKKTKTKTKTKKKKKKKRTRWRGGLYLGRFEFGRRAMQLFGRTGSEQVNWCCVSIEPAGAVRNPVKPGNEATKKEEKKNETQNERTNKKLKEKKNLSPLRPPSRSPWTQKPKRNSFYSNTFLLWLLFFFGLVDKTRENPVKLGKSQYN